MGSFVGTGKDLTPEQKAQQARVAQQGGGGFWSGAASLPGDLLNAVNPFSQGKVDFKGSNAQLGNGGQWGAAGMAHANRPGTSGSSQWSGDQRAFGDALKRQMSGQDSISREQLRQDAGRNIGMQQALAASAGPQNAAMAQRMASQNAGRINQGLAGQTAMAGIAERNAATNAYGQLAGQARGQDMQQQFGAQGLADARWGQGMGLGLNAAQGNLQASQQSDQMRLQQALAQAQMPSANQQLGGAIMGGIQTYGSMGGFQPAQQAPVPQFQLYPGAAADAEIRRYNR